MRASLPLEALATARGFLAPLDVSAPGLARGFYIIGSAALGDFRPGQSDVDAVILLHHAPDRQDRRALAHAVRASREFGTGLDAVFVTEDELRLGPDARNRGWWTRDGRLRGPSCEMRNPVVWTELARHAVEARGPATSELGLRENSGQLQGWCAANFRTYWRTWTRRAQALDALGVLSRMDRALVWGALGVSRIACTLRTGEIVSKTAAGLFALSEFGSGHAEILSFALEHRNGTVNPTPPRAAGRQLLRFIQFVKTQLHAGDATSQN